MKYLELHTHRNSLTRLMLALMAVVVLTATASRLSAQESESIESKFISSTRQLTFEGRRAGEGYYSPDGSLMVFQSERTQNPFFQIYVLDFETGDVEPISPGHGKTTCAWIHPDNNRILFASTQADPEAKAKQKAEIELRESGKARSYSWDYDDTFDITTFDRTTKEYKRLTTERGYDAEGSYSPDGKLIAFASNRNAYLKPMTERQSAMFKTHPAYMMDIFIMNSDGTNVRQLTNSPGYDGGPFFSPDGKRICWRRFSENETSAEILTMNIDGSDQKQLTHIGATSWAPYYHPSSDYLIFTTNKHGFKNFELYLVAADGGSEPIRVTDTDGFDGLASFNPDGSKITWTTNRNSKKQSQIFLADWNHEAASEAIANGQTKSNDETAAFNTGSESGKQTSAGFDGVDIMKHVDYLCRKELGGRMTGSAGERKATAYVAAYFDYLGLKPAGDDGSWFQEFDFPDGAEIGSDNRFQLINNTQVTTFVINKDWRPLTFSGNATVDPADVVFAGYGIVAPEQDGHDAYDSYADLDVKDKWVMVYRFFPEDVPQDARQHFQSFSQLRKKAFFARDNGAKGLIVVSGPNSQVREQLVPMQNDFSPTGSSIAVISITDDVAQQFMKASGKELKQLQGNLDAGTPVSGFDLKGVKLAAKVNIKKIVGKGRSVIGRLQAGDTPSAEAIIVGAHIDHLGLGNSSSSLAKQDEKNQIHFGADDNASGVAAMLEIAEYMANLRRDGKINLKRDIIFAGWSGEELGLHGSKHFADSLKTAAAPQQKSSHPFVLGVTRDGKYLLNDEPTELSDLAPDLQHISKRYPNFAIEIKADAETPMAHVTELMEFVKKQGITNIAMTKNPGADSSTKIVAALNMDMVGRMTDKLVLQGIGSSPYWSGAIESKNAVIGLPITLSDETQLPTDASSFYRAGIPILSAFTGSHTDYHTPRDTPEKLNYPDAARIARLMGLITRSLATNDAVPEYTKQDTSPKQPPRGGGRAYLGSVPDYIEVDGVKLSDVSKGSPAETAGLQGGDIVVELAGKKIENIYDYKTVIDSIKIGKPISIAVMRDGKRLELTITPGSRE